VDPALVEAACARQLQLADDPALRLRRALALERLGRDAEAIAELERLHGADPAQAGVRARLAERYEAVGRMDEAEAELRSLAAETPGRPEGWRRLAAFYRRHGSVEKARQAEDAAREVEAQDRPRRELRPLLPTGR
jgi:predicted Zn-dependent protease